KGGYEVRVAGQRGFCPLSQIDIVRTEAPEVHVGHAYTFRIIEYKEGGKDLVLSRRALLEEAQRAGAEALRETIVAGAVLTGRVVSVRDFGAFVDLGSGVQGLLHVSEMAWSRVTSPAELLAPGEDVTVKVLRVDDDGKRISLGLKQLADDPWAGVQAAFEPGQVRPGRVTRLAEFGAFVELAPGIEGLAHVSTFPPAGRGGGGWSRAVPPGTTGDFEILGIDLDKKRISLAPVLDGMTRAGRAAAAQSAAAQDADELREYAARQQQESPGGLGSLADQLRDALKPGGR
ncbi:MAG: 30S ribosomal protein S1, partial [Vicinamibacterales bacterium]